MNDLNIGADVTICGKAVHIHDGIIAIELKSGAVVAVKDEDVKSYRPAQVISTEDKRRGN